MPSLSSCRRACIVWLLLLLLPLRGWAVAAMPLAGQTMPGPDQALPAMTMADARVAVAESGADATALPCHGTGAAGPAATPSHDGPVGPHACHLCDLCHSTLGTPPKVLSGVRPPPGDRPVPLAARDTGRKLEGGLERPPRTV